MKAYHAREPEIAKELLSFDLEVRIDDCHGVTFVHDHIEPRRWRNMLSGELVPELQEFLDAAEFRLWRQSSEATIKE